VITYRVTLDVPLQLVIKVSNLAGHRRPVQGRGRRSLRVLAPTLHDTLEKVAEQGLPYLILDGTLIASDRCSDKKTSKKGTEIDK
jgi:hypothetical protein